MEDGGDNPGGGEIVFWSVIEIDYVPIDFDPPFSGRFWIQNALWNLRNTFLDHHLNYFQVGVVVVLLNTPVIN